MGTQNTLQRSVKRGREKEKPTRMLPLFEATDLLFEPSDLDMSFKLVQKLQKLTVFSNILQGKQKVQVY